MISHSKKISLFLFFVLVLVLSIQPVLAAGTSGESLTMKGNVLLHNDAADFSQGITEDTAIGIHNGSARIELKGKGEGYFTYGLYTSPEIKTDPFTQLVMSWNGDTPEGTYLSVEAQVKVGQEWSEWFSWGVWKTFGDSGSSVVRPQSLLATIDIDTLSVKNGKKANALRYRLKLYSDRSSVTPAVHLVGVSISDETTAASIDTDTGLGKLTKVLDVPMYSQRVRDPKMSGLCSPTSLAMVMDYYGIRKVPEEVAWGVKDHVGNVFGNWSFNCAYAGSYGLTAYVMLNDSVERLKQEIGKGHPMIVSVAYRNSKRVAQKFPVLDNAPISYTDGHLVVVRGFIYKNGKEYVVVNDPAAPDNDTVYREYLLSQFTQAWFKVSYVISQENTVNIIPHRIQAILTKVGTRYKKEGQLYENYVLKASDAGIDLSDDNIRSIVVEKDGKTAGFVAPDKGKYLSLPLSFAQGMYKVIIIAKQGKTYEADLEVK